MTLQPWEHKKDQDPRYAIYAYGRHLTLDVDPRRDGDTCWPGAKSWADFNAAIGGKLVTPQQLASVCHNPGYDEAACAYIQEQWTSPFLHDDSSSSTMAAAVADESCDPFTARGSCLVRLVIPSPIPLMPQILETSPRQSLLPTVIIPACYLGKSTGKWALSVWAHHMKNTTYLSTYNSKAYAGPAIKLGAGIQVEEGYRAAHAYDSLVVGGDCGWLSAGWRTLCS
ncbi:hypothetical protein O1611_g10048 [Lasiodiplodia mahajangana]|uniref:Uncharacterized protein n=1 Tax=Lasiodiplodia mahajangana TaxID=1108764 RepID=A0ACC2J2D6_9PEZI|nr:hypothetical protein O1611_g10048 [Lasiodiplodia mahajangana]